MVGSIGTIYPHAEYSKQLETAGIAVTVFTNSDSPRKSHGSPYKALDESSRSTLQEFVDSYGRPFIEDVSRYRGVDVDKVVSDYGGGDALRASVAINKGVVDRIVRDFDDTISRMIQTTTTS